MLGRVIPGVLPVLVNGRVTDSGANRVIVSQCGLQWFVNQRGSSLSSSVAVSFVVKRLALSSGLRKWRAVMVIIMVGSK